MARILRNHDARLPAASVNAARDREADAERRFLARALAAEEELARIREAHRTALPTLAIAVAERLVAAALEQRPELVNALVDEALSRLPRAAEVRIRLHDSDVPRVALEHPGRVLVADASLAPGECVVESSVGRVDGRLRTRVETLRALLAPGDPA